MRKRTGNRQCSKIRPALHNAHALTDVTTIHGVIGSPRKEGKCDLQDALQPSEPNDERERRQFGAHLVDARLEMNAWQDPAPELKPEEGLELWGDGVGACNE
jgi:hypothetical protein